MLTLMLKTLPLRNVLLCLLLLTGHDLAADSCTNENTAIPFSTPVSDFKLHNDGTVTHNTTGLMWKRCSQGQVWNGTSCTGSATTFNWQNALAENVVGYAGFADWRLPNKNELSSIVDQRCWAPSSNNTIFPNTPYNEFWTSSPYANSNLDAWHVSFFFGDVEYGNGKNVRRYVRLVRAGK